MDESTKRKNVIAILVSASVGALAMYYLDPQRGHARRSRARDKILSLTRRTTHRISQIAQNFKNRSVGAIKEFQNQMNETELDDGKLELRVRSVLGRKVRHARAIRVTVHNGIVTLAGPILKSEVKQLVAAVESVHGVRFVSDELSKYDRSADIPSLQGKGADYFQ